MACRKHRQIGQSSTINVTDEMVEGRPESNAGLCFEVQYCEQRVENA